MQMKLHYIHQFYPTTMGCYDGLHLLWPPTRGCCPTTSRNTNKYCSHNIRHTRARTHVCTHACTHVHTHTHTHTPPLHAFVIYKTFFDSNSCNIPSYNTVHKTHKKKQTKNIHVIKLYTCWCDPGSDQGPVRRKFISLLFTHNGKYLVTKNTMKHA